MCQSELKLTGDTKWERNYWCNDCEFTYYYKK